MYCFNTSSMVQVAGTHQLCMISLSKHVPFQLQRKCKITGTITGTINNNKKSSRTRTGTFKINRTRTTLVFRYH